jgi:ABC-type multidrug transport system fused ATPase/permease subunit
MITAIAVGVYLAGVFAILFAVGWYGWRLTYNKIIRAIIWPVLAPIILTIEIAERAIEGVYNLGRKAKEQYGKTERS